MWGFAPLSGLPGTKVRKDALGKDLEGCLHGMFSFHRSQNPSHRAPPVSWGRPHHHQVLLSHGLNSVSFPVSFKGPLALLPPHQSLVACQILQLRGSIRSSSCFPKSIFIPPGWLTAVQESWFAIQGLTHDIAALAQNGAHSKGMGS